MILITFVAIGAALFASISLDLKTSRERRKEVVVPQRWGKRGLW